MSRKRNKARKPRPPIQRRSKPGAAPGTLKVDPQAPQPVIRVFLYNEADVSERELGGVDEIGPLLKSNRVVWVNVDGLGDARTIRRLGELFHLHPLALEDVVNVHQRPKVEEYSDHLFVVARMAHLHDLLETEQISLFLGKNFVLTFQEHSGDCFDPVRERIRQDRGRVRQTATDYLFYVLLDAVIDAYFPVVEQFGNRLDAIEERVTFDGGGVETLAEIHSIRADLLALRRTTWWLRDAVNILIRDENPLISSDTRVYLRDIYDHTVQLIDVTETYRELSSDLREHYFSQLSLRTNDIMKVLTIIATIFIPLGFIAGLYGMNFDTSVSRWNMPELEWAFGYPFALFLMGAVAVGMLFYFWHKGWIWRGD